ncbi:MAG: glycosyl transferase family 1 [Bacteroidia bacterium]|nr:MAG: glycosyl transferase family 1 [Bacteroidia bacterium]
MNILVWAGWYPKDEKSYNGIFVKKHLQIIGQKYNLRIFHITNHRSFSFKVKQIKNDYGLERIYFIPNFKICTFFSFLIIPVYEYLSINRKADILHVHCSYPIILFAYVLKLFGLKKIVLTEHWSGYTTYDGAFDKKNALIKKYYSFLISSIDALSVVSESLLSEMQKRNLVPRKTFITPNVLIFPKQIENKLSKDFFSFCTISSLTDYSKNISGLMAVFAEAYSINKNIRLNIYGSGADEEKLKQYLNTLDIPNDIIQFKGKVNNKSISEVYFKHHAFILFSNFETFSIATAEALTHGLPVIATRSLGPEEYVNEKCGYLVDVKNKQQLKEAILLMYSNYENFDKEKIINYMKSKFSNNIILSSFDKLYLS